MLWYLAESLGIVCCFAWFFYRSFWAVILLLPVGAVYFVKRCRGWEESRRKEFEKQFSQCILAVAAGLRAGYSVENAFRESIGEMKMMFGENSRIVLALKQLVRGLQNNIPLERLLLELGRGNSFAEEFADVFQIACKSGGSLTDMIADTAESMNAQRQLEEEVQDLISGKKLEQKVMNCIPFFIVAYIGITNDGYFDVLYHNLPGILFMTVCLTVYLAAYAISAKIADIGREEGD